MAEVNQPWFWYGIAIILFTLGLTIYVFRRRLFDRGYKVGKAANPEQVRRQNPPDPQDRGDPVHR